ncbi:hypothetical protein GCM10020366_51720 [Saccharopolyspora gregorii]|uniref:Uncharacterized protein n=1 Tax=Saccharopolyspora gregorii TaxID=33914 RepID=A0ABP6RXI4_9PSEU
MRAAPGVPRAPGGTVRHLGFAPLADVGRHREAPRPVPAHTLLTAPSRNVRRGRGPNARRAIRSPRVPAGYGPRNCGAEALADAVPLVSAGLADRELAEFRRGS